jgi:hypothetical protein
MRKFVLFPLLALLFLVGCSDAVGVGSRSVDGEWTARVDGEDVWMSLREDSRGRVTGSGDWGWDRVYVRGDRRGSDVYLVFEFDRFSPINFDGSLRSGELDGRLTGSGWTGQRVTFRRDRF